MKRKKKRPPMTARLPKVRDVAPSPEALRKLAGEPETAHRAPSTVAGTWESSHKRVTFHCPVEVLEAVRARTADTPRSDLPTRSAFIVEALRRYLAELEREGR